MKYSHVFSMSAPENMIFYIKNISYILIITNKNRKYIVLMVQFLDKQDYHCTDYINYDLLRGQLLQPA